MINGAPVLSLSPQNSSLKGTESHHGYNTEVKPKVLTQLHNFVDLNEISPLFKNSGDDKRNSMVMQVMMNPSVLQERVTRRNVLLNISNCRGEIDTLQYVCRKYDYREAKEPDSGNLFWYGLALRDSDMEMLKAKKCMINRYPLMDVSLYRIIISYCLPESN